MVVAEMKAASSIRAASPDSSRAVLHILLRMASWSIDFGGRERDATYGFNRATTSSFRL